MPIRRQANNFVWTILALTYFEDHFSIDILTRHLSGISLRTESSIVISERDLDKTLILSGMGTDTSDGEIKLMDSWKNSTNRNMNEWNVINADFDMNKLAPLIDKIRTFRDIWAKKSGLLKTGHIPQMK